MSSTNLNTVSYSDSHRRSYITTGPFSSNIFSYSTSMNAQFVTVGSLTAKSVPSELNVAGTILRENGRKLYPGANPGISTYMVGVYHESIGSAFIDPNAHVFAVYSGSKPYFAADGVDPDTDEVDWSAPVYTRGVVYAQDDITTSADLHVNGSADISGNLTVRGTVDLANNLVIGTTSMVGGTVSGGFIRKTVSTTAVTANSKIFFTYAGLNNPGVLSAENIVPGVSFQIVSNNTLDAGSVNWLVIN